MDREIKYFLKHLPNNVKSLDIKINGLIRPFQLIENIESLKSFTKVDSKQVISGNLAESYISQDFNFQIKAYSSIFLIPDNNILFTSTDYPSVSIRIFETDISIHLNSLEYVQDIDYFKNIASLLYKWVLDSPMIFSIKEQEQVLFDLLSLLEIPNDKFNFFIFPQVVDLTMEDLISGKLVNNQVGYTVSFKADGYHKILFSSSSGIWLILPGNDTIPSKFQKVLDGNFPVAILEGESILKDTKFLVFDTMYYGHKITRHNYITRLKIAQDAISVLKQSCKGKFKIEKKDTIIINTKKINDRIAMENFFTRINSLIYDIHINYDTDGFVFTPINVPYNNLSDKFTPKVLKWKPPENLTIDFTFNDYKLYTSRDEFNPPGFNPSINVNWDSIYSQNLPLGAVVELSPVLTNNVIVLTFTRYRFEKSKGNNPFVARNLWKMIQNPITLEMLKGNTFTFVRKYHNRIKNNLLDKIPEGSYLLDIGSGRGGDLFKWKNLSKVLGIEPDQDNAREFNKRLSEIKLYNQDIKLLIKPCCSEFDYLVSEFEEFFKLNKNSPPLYISMMLSLSFFWKDKQTLQSLAKFIKYISTLYHSITFKHVNFIYFTVEGDGMRELFNKYGPDVRLGPAFIQDYDNEIHINIDDSIVRNQVEYFVDLNDLFDLAGLKPIYSEYANKDKLMSKDEQVFTRLYKYGKSISEETYPLVGETRILKVISNNKTFKLNYHGVEIKRNLKNCLDYFNIKIKESDENLTIYEIAEKYDLCLTLIEPDILYTRTSDKDRIKIYSDKTRVLFPID